MNKNHNYYGVTSKSKRNAREKCNNVINKENKCNTLKTDVVFICVDNRTISIHIQRHTQ